MDAGGPLLLVLIMSFHLYFLLTNATLISSINAFLPPLLLLLLLLFPPFYFTTNIIATTTFTAINTNSTTKF